MATRPTVGGSDGTWGTELNAHLDISLDTDGKVDDGAAQTTSAAPTADAELANKKYVDDQIASASGSCKAWGHVISDGTLQGSGFNVSTARDSEGTYTLTWGTNFADDDYAVPIGIINNPTTRVVSYLTNFAVGSCKVHFVKVIDGTHLDSPFTFAAFGDQ